tara:strand:+ start:346 stop:528 length:183 start_codon:yes stop_codon:yes gene_type:complete
MVLSLYILNFLKLMPTLSAKKIGLLKSLIHIMSKDKIKRGENKIIKKKEKTVSNKLFIKI